VGEREVASFVKYGAWCVTFCLCSINSSDVFLMHGRAKWALLSHSHTCAHTYTSTNTHTHKQTHTHTHAHTHTRTFKQFIKLGVAVPNGPLVTG
jgi:hypothetical protein